MWRFFRARLPMSALSSPTSRPPVAPRSVSSATSAMPIKVVTAWGGIDILVNNAFYPSAAFSSIIELSVEQLQRNFEIGPIAYLRMMQASYSHLKASGEGRVINFGSMAGVIGLVGYGPYNMAKEAVRALTRTAAREWGADKITVNNVLPIAETWVQKLMRRRRPTRSVASDRRKKISRPSSCSSRAKIRSSLPAPVSRRTAARSSTARADTRAPILRHGLHLRQCIKPPCTRRHDKARNRP